MNVDDVVFDGEGLVPAVVQDANSKEVLTVAYMNRESLKKTIDTKETWFYSRSRQSLWHKGETSGNVQQVSDIRFDCDRDALLVLVHPRGPACHRGTYSCFTESLYHGEAKQKTEGFEILRTLAATIAERNHERPEGAYTTYLFEEGVDKILKKLGEEASEIIIAAKNRDREELSWESADFIYHLVVLLEEQQLPLDRVMDTLRERHGK
ncbi:bifunctional phosphoribosyl-AMP cyclohydrolase/phosphoribosyl-ATP diphosphatase HisIE [Salicibibacter halophilus]|uniref:Histidine biosynthesis bifunctional protein HisIE n=1 Tax=Salicibibacter halophilus TaxID=2502791 RepID=A0A514LJ45_9BACI|nr:bifunctional phosphoribosyl-AMP cyclohydrolase/phosphoribosyl-ATP diphosphatase HisIE [Salicibibacter halophilus]QDI91874.1 bifunctional phosphoribosyl-AMP cyclohydrolase/phosphoribosyl-ATP diphosphatase HisIE [Salicibibacter halophilus]